MPLYMARFGYTPDAWAGLVQSPDDRKQTVGRILDEAGCKLKDLWYSFGPEDGFALIEAPDNTTAAGISIAVSSSGAFRSFETSILMTQAEMLKALDKAADVAYTAPGAAVHA